MRALAGGAFTVTSSRRRELVLDKMDRVVGKAAAAAVIIMRRVQMGVVGVVVSVSRVQRVRH